MKKFGILFIGVILAALVGTAFAFTPFPAGGNVVPVLVSFDAVTGTATGVPVMKAAGRYRVAEFGAVVRAVNSGSLTVQLIRNGTDNVSTPLAVSTAWAEGSVAAGNSVLAANDNLSITFGGSSPNVSNLGVILYLRKE